jgi:hypothetical protein
MPRNAWKVNSIAADLLVRCSETALYAAEGCIITRQDNCGGVCLLGNSQLISCLINPRSSLLMDIPCNPCHNPRVSRLSSLALRTSLRH